jgi:hypothetical protein
MTYLFTLFILFLLWRWRIRDLIKRAIILLSIPVLHMHFLKKAENPLAFQAWTLAGLALLVSVIVYRLVARIRRRPS